MNGTVPAVAVSLPVYSPEDAESRGFVSITTDVSLSLEGPILESIQASLKGTRACLIVVGKGVFQAARAKSELWTGS